MKEVITVRLKPETIEYLQNLAYELHRPYTEFARFFIEKGVEDHKKGEINFE